MTLILLDINLLICNLYSPPIKTINIHTLQPSSEDWMIVGNFKSHYPSLGYPRLDARGEEVEQWTVSNCLALIKTPINPSIFYSTVWKATSTPDTAIATETFIRMPKEKSVSRLEAVILTLAKVINTSAGKLYCYPIRTTRKWTGNASEKSLISTLGRPPCPGPVSTRIASLFTLQAKESTPRGRRLDYKQYWNKTLEKIRRERSEA